MLSNPVLMKAVASIKQRSEKQPNIDKLVESFVDVGILPQLNNANSQILFGRRGTGKTHVLSVLGEELRENLNHTVVYIDARTLGSTSQFTDEGVSLKTRCVSLFRDVLGQIYNGLLEHIIEHPTTLATQALKELDELGSLVTEVVAQQSDVQIVSRQKETGSQSGNASVTLSQTPSVSLGATRSSGQEAETTCRKR